MNKIPLYMILFIFIFQNSLIQAENTVDNANKEWEAIKAAEDTKWDELKERKKKQWEDLAIAHQKRWDQLKAEVEEKWQAFVHSTKKDWVDYDRDRDTRSRVDFKHGDVIFETVIPEDDSQPRRKALENIKKQVGNIFAKKDIGKKGVLDDQIVDNQGNKVDHRNPEKFIKKEILPKIKPDPKSYTSKDGLKRRKYRVKISLVPNHIRIRAEKYLPTVRTNAKRFKLKPQLVFAVIHTESYFNPMAVSSSNAIGMMQIIPKYAGREAYIKLYGDDTVPTWKYLFLPENNIKLGSVYLSLLRYRHFRDIHGEVKNRYISVCGYNWGPTAMRKKIVKKYPLNSMSDGQVYSLLRKKTPKETRDYIKRVIERIPLYDSFF